MRLLKLSWRNRYGQGFSALALVTTLGWWGDVNGLPPDRPKVEDRQIAKIIHMNLPVEHISRRPMDNEISQRALPLFLESLDIGKVYFTQADIDEFSLQRNNLDDMAKDGQLKFAYDVYFRFLERVKQRVVLATKILDGPIDFGADDEIVVNPDLVSYPRSDEEVRTRWIKKIKYDLLVLKGQKTEGEKAVEKLKKRYVSFHKRIEQMDGDELLETFLTSLTMSYDPHTSYMSPSQLDNFRILMRLNLEGIGAALSPEDGYTVVSNIIPGGAADKHGQLRVKDRIVSVSDGESGEMIDVVDLKLNDVVKKIRGPAGSIVKLGVISEGETETKLLTITRAKIELEDSAARGVVIDQGKKSNGQPYRVGVIDIPSFYLDMEAARENARGMYRSTTRDVKRILEEFNTKGVDVVLVDLRKNGGGSLPEAIHLTGLFIDLGPVVMVKDANGAVAHHTDEDPGMVWSGPLVVVTSKFSASASEIFAGAIQDYQRGIIIGDESTHGKGTVQSLMDLGGKLFRVPSPKNLGALKVTMQQFYRPNGDSTQKRGVVSDVVVPSLTNYIAESEGNLDYALDFDHIEPARFRKVGMMNGEIAKNISSLSETRRNASKDFQKLERTITAYREYKNLKAIPLNEKKFFEQRAELEAEKDEEKQTEEIQRDKTIVFKRDFLNNELLAISVDFVEQLQQNKFTASRGALR